MTMHDELRRKSPAQLVSNARSHEAVCIDTGRSYVGRFLGGEKDARQHVQIGTNRNVVVHYLR